MGEQVGVALAADVRKRAPGRRLGRAIRSPVRVVSRRGAIRSPPPPDLLGRKSGPPGDATSATTTTPTATAASASWRRRFTRFSPRLAGPASARRPGEHEEADPRDSACADPSDGTGRQPAYECREQRQRGAADHRKGRDADTGDAVLRHQQARIPSIVRQAATCAALSSSRPCASSIIFATRLSFTR